MFYGGILLFKIHEGLMQGTYEGLLERVGGRELAAYFSVPSLRWGVGVGWTGRCFIANFMVEHLVLILARSSLLHGM